MLEDVLQRRPYNAAADFVDANVARGLGDKVAFTDSQRSLTYAQLQDELLPVRGGIAGFGSARGKSRHPVVPRYRRSPGRLLGRDPRRHYPGSHQYAADGRAISLSVCGQPGSRGHRRCSAGPDPAVVAASPSLPAHDHRGRGERKGTGRAAGCAVLRGPAGAGEPTPLTAATMSDDVAFWMYSSGSTGKPKAVRHVHTSLMATARSWARA